MIDCALPNSDFAGIAPPITITEAEVRHFAAAIGLTRAAPDRCSMLLMFDLYCRAFFPVPGDPAKVVAEVRGLEGIGGAVGTKPTAQFKHPPLQGLWKKHYLVGGLPSIAANIQLGFGRQRNKLHQIIQKHWNPATAALPPEVSGIPSFRERPDFGAFGPHVERMGSPKAPHLSWRDLSLDDCETRTRTSGLVIRDSPHQNANLQLHFGPRKNEGMAEPGSGLTKHHPGGCRPLRGTLSRPKPDRRVDHLRAS